MAQMLVKHLDRGGDMTGIVRGLAVFGVVLLAAPTAHAAPTAVGVGAFASAPIDSTVADGVLITTQLPGMTVSGGLFGNSTAAIVGFLGAGGPEVTTNFAGGLPPACPSPACPDITIDFASSITRFGLVISNAELDDLTLIVFNGGSSLGSLTYTTGVTGVFVGIEDLNGFNRV